MFNAIVALTRDEIVAGRDGLVELLSLAPLPDPVESMIDAKFTSVAGGPHGGFESARSQSRRNDRSPKCASVVCVW